MRPLLAPENRSSRLKCGVESGGKGLFLCENSGGEKEDCKHSPKRGNVCIGGAGFFPANGEGQVENGAATTSAHSVQVWNAVQSSEELIDKYMLNKRQVIFSYTLINFSFARPSPSSHDGKLKLPN